MATKKKLANAAFVSVAAEMAKPRIAASALKALRSKAPSQHRELVLIDSFNGYECSQCKCRFPESALPKGASLTGRTGKLQIQQEFDKHVCSFFPQEDPGAEVGSGL
jgi:hypothetical protein